jgi:hypothetical protein
MRGGAPLLAHQVGGHLTTGQDDAPINEKVPDLFGSRPRRLEMLLREQLQGAIANAIQKDYEPGQAEMVLKIVKTRIKNEGSQLSDADRALLQTAVLDLKREAQVNFERRLSKL